MEKLAIMIMVLTDQTRLISQIEEVGADIGEPGGQRPRRHAGGRHRVHSPHADLRLIPPRPLRPARLTPGPGNPGPPAGEPSA